MASRFSVETVFKGVDKVSAPVRRISKGIGRMTVSASRGLDRLSKKTRKLRSDFGRLTSSIGRKAFTTITIGAIAVGAAMADIVKTGATFEQSLVNAAAKFKGVEQGSKAFKKLEDAAKRTGRTTEFTASQAAEALNFLAMAGFSAEGAIAALPGVVDLATASNTDLATATDIASDSLGAFNLLSKDTQKQAKSLARINDVMAKTSVTANTNLEQMFEAIKEGGPVATTAGASVETFSALVGKMADAGIKGSRAGTTLKNMFLKLSAPSNKGASVLRRLGVETQDSAGNMRDIIDIIGDLDKATRKLGTAQKTGVLEAIFGKIPIAGVNVLLNQGADGLREYRNELLNAEGSSRKMAETMRNTVAGSFKSLGSAVEGVKIGIFGLNKGPLKELLDNTTKWIRENQPAIERNVQSAFVFTKTFVVEASKNFKFFAEDVAESWDITTGVLEDAFTIMFFGWEMGVKGMGKKWDEFVTSVGDAKLGLSTIFIDDFATNLATARQIWQDIKKGTLGLSPQEEAQFKKAASKERLAHDRQFGAGGRFPGTGQQGPDVEILANPRGLPGQSKVISPIERSETIRKETETRNKIIIEDKTGRAKADGKLPAAIELQQSGDF